MFVYETNTAAEFTLDQRFNHWWFKFDGSEPGLTLTVLAKVYEGGNFIQAIPTGSSAADGYYFDRPYHSLWVLPAIDPYVPYTFTITLVGW